MPIHSDPETLKHLHDLTVLYAEDDEGVQQQLARLPATPRRQVVGSVERQGRIGNLPDAKNRTL